jgi:hypothetical protein
MKTIEIGGNKIKMLLGKIWLNIANRCELRGSRLQKAGIPSTVSNPSSRFVNPFTLLITFTVNNTDKYQLVHEGDFKDRYRELVKPDEEEGVSEEPIEEKELFIIIGAYRKKWFQKK